MASSRFPNSTLHQRDSRSALFEGYNGGGRSSSDATTTRRQFQTPSPSPGSVGGGYGYSGGYPGSNGNGDTWASTTAAAGGASGQRRRTREANKVGILKSMSVAMGDEIRNSTAMMEKMNDTFDNTRLRVRGTMNRMMIMADRTGVGWRVWLGFFAAVIFIFLYVWLF
ncbi:SNARE domain-containing protein [Apiospora arundinis]